MWKATDSPSRLIRAGQLKARRSIYVLTPTNRRFSLDARKLKSICCVKRLFLFFLLASSAQAQFIAPGSGSNQFGGFSDSNATVGPTDTPTWDPMIPTYTPTPTPTYNPFATTTDTSTPGSPTDTPSNTFTPTATGTIDTPTPTWSPTPVISRASLVLLPTAYSNAT